jgi:demethylmenaquinone methyltransferase/2-methoxy-6-polyprenyl-1,4-benzoquinol methylase
MNPLANPAFALSDPERKRTYNRLLFEEVAPRYDRITRLLSLGRDAAWKRWMISRLPQDQIGSVLDLACGTGDITSALRDAYPQAGVTGVDLCPDMLEIARERYPDGLHFLEADMSDLPMEDGTLDLVTGGYALRNAPDLQQTLAEIHRVLRPGGRLAVLDFSAPAQPLLRKIQSVLLWLWGGWWGLVMHGNPAVYAYIARSLDRFPARPDLHRQLEAEGLPVQESRRFMFGMIEVFICEKRHTPDS